MSLVIGMVGELWLACIALDKLGTPVFPVVPKALSLWQLAQSTGLLFISEGV